MVVVVVVSVMMGGGGGHPGDSGGDGQTYGVDGEGSGDATTGSHRAQGNTSLLGENGCTVR